MTVTIVKRAPANPDKVLKLVNVNGGGSVTAIWRNVGDPIRRTNHPELYYPPRWIFCQHRDGFGYLCGRPRAQRSWLGLGGGCTFMTMHF